MNKKRKNIPKFEKPEKYSKNTLILNNKIKLNTWINEKFRYKKWKCDEVIDSFPDKNGWPVENYWFRETNDNEKANNMTGRIDDHDGISSDRSI